MENKRPYVMMYWDILSKLDDPYELSVYVYLKKHADRLTGTCFPSVAKLEEETKISEKKVRLILKKLKEKGLITIQSRTLENGGKTSNIYKLLEFDETLVEQRKRVSEVDQTDQSRSTQDTQSDDITNLRLHNNPFLDDSQAKNQAEEVAAKAKCSKEELKARYMYQAMIAEEPARQESIDTCIDIIFSAISSQKKTLRIQKEDVAQEQVADRLLKLTKEDIFWVLDKIEHQPSTIYSPQAYILTLLYSAKEQKLFDTQNKRAVAAAAVAPSAQPFKNFTERKNNRYTEKILKQYSQQPDES